MSPYLIGVADRHGCIDLGAIHLGDRSRQARFHPALSRSAPALHPDRCMVEMAWCRYAAEVWTLPDTEAWQPDDMDRDRCLGAVLPDQERTRAWTVCPSLPEHPPERHFRWYIGAIEYHREVSPAPPPSDDSREKSIAIAIERWNVRAEIMCSVCGDHCIDTSWLSG